MELTFTNLQEDFWFGESDLGLFLDCPFTMGGGIILLCTEGEATVSVGIQECDLKKNADLKVLPGTTFSLIRSSINFRCILFTFSKEVYDESSLRLGIDFPVFLAEKPFIIHANDSIYLKNIYIWMDMAKLIFENKEAQLWYQMHRNFVQNYLMYLLDKVQDHFRMINKKFTREDKLFHQFSSLLDIHCREHRDVAYYADKLNITTRYLWTITNHVTEFESPKEVIDKRSVLEIKVLLQSTDLTVQEIANDLKFPDQSYLGRFFKRHTGISPREYRNKVALTRK
ncbi:MAG: helix-turn-helix domain-containing protein [Prevotella sp.]|jgi:AraC-like DNA-binding protein|nr:helix-turn-helix domain-containing protein [Prevotella sp.]